MLTNLQICELLARESETDDDLPLHVRKAYKKAARATFGWPVEAYELIKAERSLTELRSVGPFLASRMHHWFAHPPEIEETPALRRDFLNLVEVRKTLDEYPGGAPWPLGDLHTHTNWSDGKNTLMEMAEGAEERGYNYLAITDHGEKLKIARGLDRDRLAAQGLEIAAVNEELQARGFRVRLLRSSETNFDPKGQPDYTPEILDGLDFVIGAFHSKLRLTEDQTERYLAAVECPHVDVLAHPRTRIFNFRLGLTADWNRVMERAAQLGKALEIDGIPDRQDMSSDLLAIAAKHDVWISLGSDAHAIAHLPYLDFALAAALRAGIREERILNLLTLDELMSWRAGRLEGARASRS